MFTKINQSQFIDSFRSMVRETQFSYKALVALFHHMEDTEENCGEEVELDVIALCCEYAEYEDIEEYNADYDKAETMEDNPKTSEALLYRQCMVKVCDTCGSRAGG